MSFFKLDGQASHAKSPAFSVRKTVAAAKAGAARPGPVRAAGSLAMATAGAIDEAQFTKF